MRVGGALWLIVVLAGCQTTSKVEYRTVSSPADMLGMTDSFYLRRSTLEISATSGPANPADRSGGTQTTITIQAPPREFPAVRIGIAAHRGFLSSTKINITKVENTDLVKSIGVETTDETLNRINQIGGAIVKVIKSGAVGGLSDIPCLTGGEGKLTFNLDPSLPSQTFNTVRQGCIVVTYGSVPAGAIPFEDLPKNKPTSLYYYAACRDAEVVIDQGGGAVRREPVKINDPRYLQYVEFPVKGKIEHHSQCGVSVASENYTSANAADVVGALAEQGKAIKDALEAASANKH
jgi:hypothetical protein